ncbi:MAG: SDR family NAD(P)-dependent oxidoreductase [Bacteroidota bacterium]|jgi:NAD(P)-dependent dehydrogenase (short-subunit alcohol dehydrogenase family)
MILVTGSTDGIGKETALGLLRKGARVLLHGRDAARLESTRSEFAAAGFAAAGTIIGDFTRFESVRAMAAELREKYEDLNVLVNNVGVYMKKRVETPDKNEMTWQVNYLAPALLTLELMPLLEKNTPSRIINVSSIAHTRGGIDFFNLHAQLGFDSYAAYAQSKLANVLFTYELASQLSGKGVDVNCLHPGVIGTKLLMDGFGLDGASVEEGARTSIRLAISEDLAGVSGKYFVKEQPTPSSPMSYDTALRKKLWLETIQSIS